MSESTTTTAASTLTAPDIEKASQVRLLFEQARSHKKNRYEIWNRSYRMLHNRGWSNLRQQWMPSPLASEIYPIVASMVGWMTDQRPGLSVVPAVDPHSKLGRYHSELASDLEKVLRSTWIAHDTTAEVEKVLWDAAIYGTGFFKTVWDESLEGGQGQSVIKRTDPWVMFIDPAATSLDDANYIIEARNTSLQEIDRRFPGASKRLMDSPVFDDLERREDLFRSEGGSDVPKANPAGINGVAPRFGRPGGGKRERASTILDGQVTLIEAWIRRHEQWTDDEGVAHIEDGWHVVVMAGNEILMDEPAKDLWTHGRHPYTRYTFGDLGDLWGVSLVEHLTPLQTAINRLLAALQANAELVGNPVFLEDTRAGIARTKITNKPGTRLVKNQGSEAGWLTPPEMPSSVSELVRFYIGEMERISGLSAIVRGATPTGRNAQGVLDSVQEAAFVRVRLALRNLERSLRDAGELQASLIVENYSAPRYMAVLGPEGGQKVSMSLRGRHFYVPNKEGTGPMKFSLIIEAGSSMPISRQARAQEADVLFGMGALDTLAVLEAHDWPNRNEIYERITKAQAMGAFEPPGKRKATRS